MLSSNRSGGKGTVPEHPRLHREATTIKRKSPWPSYLFAVDLVEALFAPLGGADWENSGYNWPGTDFAVSEFLVH